MLSPCHGTGTPHHPQRDQEAPWSSPGTTHTAQSISGSPFPRSGGRGAGPTGKASWLTGNGEGSDFTKPLVTAEHSRQALGEASRAGKGSRREAVQAARQ